MAKGLRRSFTILVAGLVLGLVLGPIAPQAYGQEMPKVNRQYLIEPFVTSDIPKEAVVNVYVVTIPPGAESGWHSHDSSKPGGPGPAIAYFMEGTATIEEKQPDGSITTKVLGPGSVYWESGITHNGKNLGNTPVTVFVIRFDMPK
ncbi:MAG: cupin domain-containing protein [candidate division NC10 bacterium]|nr:cupin domain-containing protein [candidate division NC10 bacterium]